jgi:hypothetical protein
MTAFRDITPCSLLQVDGRFRDVYCLYQQSDDGGSEHTRNVGKLVVFSSSLVEVDRSFRRVSCLYVQGDNGGSKHIWNVGKLVVLLSSLVKVDRRFRRVLPLCSGWRWRQYAHLSVNYETTGRIISARCIFMLAAVSSVPEISQELYNLQSSRMLLASSDTGEH